jgi:hypothetical protein
MRSNNAGCLTALVSGGSRLLLLLYWISRPVQWNVAFGGAWLLPCLGFIFLPFTTLVYVWLVQGVGTINGIDWLWLGLAVFVDIANTASAGYANRNRMPGYTTPAAPPPSSTPSGN